MPKGGESKQVEGLNRALRQGKRTNVLLSSVGRRSYLVHYFRQALAKKGLVIATNSLADTTGMRAADESYVIPPAADSRFVDELVGVCARREVLLLFSLHDWEAPFIASHVEEFRAVGTIPVVSASHVLELCLDKLKTQEFAHSHGIACPFTVSSPEEARGAVLAGSMRAPLVVKPRFGQGSIGIQTVWDESDFAALHRMLMKRIGSVDSYQFLTAAGRDSLLFQEFIEGEEFGLDVVNDLNGKFVVCFVKHKIHMRAGETDIAETVDDPLLEDLGRRIGGALGHIGLLDVDLVVRDGVPFLLDMNPRFGGHYPFSHMAGADIPAALVAWALGVEPDPSWLRVRPGVKCLKDITLVVHKKEAKK